MRVGEAVWGSSAVFENFHKRLQVFRNLRGYRETFYRHSVFEFGRTLLCVITFFTISYKHTVQTLKIS